MNKELKVPRCPEIRAKYPDVTRQRIRQLEYAKAGICGMCCTNPAFNGGERCELCLLRYRLSRPSKNRYPATWKENKPKLIEDLKLLDWSLPPEVNAEKMDLTVAELKRYALRYLGKSINAMNRDRLALKIQGDLGVLNALEISKKYDIPYGTLCRHIKKHTDVKLKPGRPKK